MRKVYILIFFLCALCNQLNAAGKDNVAYRNFWHPAFNGLRLNYCTLDGQDCGETVANHYCQLLGYDYSSQSVIAYNVGLTNFLGARATCKGWQCNGFMTIGCATKLSHTPPQPYHYREKRFANPRYNNYRVDWCYDLKKGCGSRAANSFCSRMGFMQAKQFAKEVQVAATKAIGSQQLCFGNECTGFKTIVCYR